MPRPKRKAASVSSTSKLSSSKRPRLSSSQIKPPTEALIPFPSGTISGKGQLKLTDIEFNRDATVTCDYSFRGVGALGSFQHLGSAFVTDDDLRVRANTWVNVHYSDSPSDDDDDASPTAPALLVHLLSLQSREFALIAWGFAEDDEEVMGLLDGEDAAFAPRKKGIVPSDYFQIVETEAIAGVLGAGKLGLMEYGKKEREAETTWRGQWLIKFGGGKGGGLWKPEAASEEEKKTDITTPASTSTKTKKASPKKSANGTTESTQDKDTSTFVDAAETLSGAAADAVEKVTDKIAETAETAAATGQGWLNRIMSPMKSPTKSAGKSPAKTYGKSPARSRSN